MQVAQSWLLIMVTCKQVISSQFIAVYQHENAHVEASQLFWTQMPTFSPKSPPTLTINNVSYRRLHAILKKYHLYSFLMN